MADGRKVLIVHNKYIFRGGEDSVVESEGRLLESYGNLVHYYFEDNKELIGRDIIAVAVDAVWSRRSFEKMLAMLTLSRPDIIHVHNFFPQISPAVFWAANRKGIPVVQTLHNFRYACLQAMFLRNGRICEDCLNTLPVLGVARRCYRDSYAQSFALATSYVVHKALGTFKNKVSRYIALNEFCRFKMIECGLPAEKLDVKPNFVEMGDMPPVGGRSGGLFVGRLSTEKGISLLIRAVESGLDVPINVIGDGPERNCVAHHFGVNFLGWLQSDEVYRAMRQAAYLIMPSLWYENFPRTLVEAFACALPVIASRLGAMAELIDDGQTGLLFTPGSSEDLAEKINWATSHPEEMRRMGQRARQVYEGKYTPSRNYDILIDIYEKAIKQERTMHGRRTEESQE